MEQLQSNTAFVTGAAQGIGLGICRALARAGTDIILADVQPNPLRTARDEIAALGVRASTITLDVSDRAAYGRVAAQIEADYPGGLHVLVNNAGVSVPPGPVSALSPHDWDWMLGVNLHGVINGTQLLLPSLRRHGGPAHIVNTASIAGLQVRPGRGTGGYATTKFAVVAYSEALQQELAATPIGVSVLCPAAVDTAIYRASEHRPERFGGPLAPQLDEAAHRTLLPNAMHPDVVGRHVVRAIAERRFMIVTHPETKAWLQTRHDGIMAAYDALSAEAAEDAVRDTADPQPSRSGQEQHS